jgi:SAM-dependent methyltransferase
MLLGGKALCAMIFYMSRYLRKLAKMAIRYSLLPFVFLDYLQFSRKAKLEKPRFMLSLKSVYPRVLDKTVSTQFDRHYVYHTAWAARVLKESGVTHHTDISSSLYFSAIVSAFLNVDFYDYRPAALSLSNLSSKKGDLMSLPFADGSISSLSCMHVVEHVGLGRYGDPVDPNGDKKAAAELSRVLAKNGSLLFVVPVAEVARIEWNAHRIYSYDEVIALFPGLQLVEFSYIPEQEEKGGLMRNAQKSDLVGERYACGCFHFTKTGSKI